jgi:hypothetical protein
MYVDIVGFRFGDGFGYASPATDALQLQSGSQTRC